MGVAVSGYRLARAVAALGQLGVVSGTALDVVLARRLQSGDPTGELRRAIGAFPDVVVAERVLRSHFVPGGHGEGAPFAHLSMFTASPTLRRQELAVVGGFVEVFLAKEGHRGPVGINFNCGSDTSPHPDGTCNPTSWKANHERMAIKFVRTITVEEGMY